MSRLKICISFGDITITRAFEQGRMSTEPDPLLRGISVLAVSSEGLLHLDAFYHKQWMFNIVTWMMRK
jgi:hypothetical protein